MLGACQVEYNPFGKPPLKREGQRGLQHKLHEFVGRVKTEMAEVDVAELGHSRLLAPHQRALGGVEGLPGLDKVEAWRPGEEERVEKKL